MFVLVFIVASYTSKVFVAFVCNVLFRSFTKPDDPFNNLLEIEVGVMFTIFIAADIQPRFENQYLRPVIRFLAPKLASRKMSLLTHFLVSLLYMYLSNGI